MKVLVTGASGFVGSYACAELIKQKHEPVAFMRQRTDGKRPYLWDYLKIEPEVYEGDIRDSASIRGALDKHCPLAVIHLAAKAYVPYSYTNPTDVFETNVRGTFNMLEAIRQHGHNPKFVFAGSSEEYGKATPSDMPLGVASFLHPVSPYAESKVMGEKMTLLYHKLYGMDTVVSRAFNHEGPGRGEMYVTTAICKQAVRPGSEIVLGNVNSFRDWSHVKDIARGYVALSEHGTAGRVYIQGSGKMYSVLTFALKALEDIEGQTVEGIETLDGEYLFDNPLETVYIRNSQWSQNKLDDAMISCAMRGEELFPIERYGISVVFNGPVNRRNIVFSPDKWRRIDVPMLLAASNMHEVGIRPSERAPLPELIHDMNNYELGVHC